MRKKELTEILEQHKLWLNSESGERADLSGAYLRYANLSGAYLGGANLRYANLKGANLRYANLTGANLSDANLIDANLIDANLRGAYLRGAYLSDTNLSGAYLSGADFSGADLSDANFSGANLRGAYLSDTNLSGASFSGANLRGADLSGAKGILDAAEWIHESFESTTEGVVVYKAFGDIFYCAPERWEISEGTYITEVCNPCRTDDCGCGVNFGTLEWIHSNIDNPTPIWKCLIKWIDLVSVVVPYNTDGKARCERLELLERIE